MNEKARTMTEPRVSVEFQQRELFPELPDEKTMAAWVAAAAERDVEITIRFVDEAEGVDLNSRYRHKDYATNVLTFDYEHEPVVRADLAICVPVLVRQAREQGKTFLAHLCHLIVHGTLHAHGYDHVTQEQADVMEPLEIRILQKIGFEDPYQDRGEQPADSQRRPLP